MNLPPALLGLGIHHDLQPQVAWHLVLSTALSGLTFRPVLSFLSLLVFVWCFSKSPPRLLFLARYPFFCTIQRTPYALNTPHELNSGFPFFFCNTTPSFRFEPSDHQSRSQPLGVEIRTQRVEISGSGSASHFLGPQTQLFDLSVVSWCRNVLVLNLPVSK